ncbi:MAG TPA: Asp-tRNA(Asn)/Glu-tRNA(Gln) amidotransferase subunit GatB [Candidatus Methylomirabilis sp.]|nr:Asp-tRNA(Asn)/Glu-tRNA(Gln) amidotransferase subunit GatB [Candidatus Methylomirabilis sp.]
MNRELTYEAVIGLEVHAQLLTASKIFCGCSTRFGEAPNSQTCPVCLGLPGVLPVLNKKAVEFAIRTALAVRGSIAPHSVFARKNYFYPDLPKDYQISQYELPLSTGGFVEVSNNGMARRVRIRRVHLEEDAGKLLHAGTMDRAEYSLVDFNRCGVPLIEMVTEPDLRTPEAAAEFLKEFRTILQYLGVSQGNMEEGNLRCDANVSVRPAGSVDLGVKTEVKNMNSFKNVQRALEYEIGRQIRLLKSGQPIVQETHLWDAEQGITLPMRGKEEAHDYRYFPEPDLVPLEISPAWVEEIAASLPELPADRRQRFVQVYGLPEYDAAVLTASKALADFFEECTHLHRDVKLVSNWIMSELLGHLNREGKEITESPVTPAQLAALLKLIQEAVISGKIAKVVFEEMYQTGKSPEAIIREKGLIQITDREELGRIVDQVLAENPGPVSDFRGGKEKALTALVGAVMRMTKGKANPQLINDLLREKLAGGKVHPEE